MRRNRNTKIIATLGPASSSVEMIQKLFMAGADVFRLNFSHGSHADHAERHAMIRQVEKNVGRPISILADLQGPKLRVGQFENGFAILEVGQRFSFDTQDKLGDQQRVRLPHPEIFAAIQVGHELLIDDGKLRLVTREVHADRIVTEVTVGGKISDRKGVNLPGTLLPMSVLTEKDRRDLEFALELGMDWIALSFVQRAQDIHEIKALVGPKASIVAKLEKPQAVADLVAIVEATDAVMVARGDLGVEMPTEDVPVLQKRIVRACREAGKPVIVATQMLESMIQAPAPTRGGGGDAFWRVWQHQSITCCMAWPNEWLKR